MRPVHYLAWSVVATLAFMAGAAYLPAPYWEWMLDLAAAAGGAVLASVLLFPRWLVSQSWRLALAQASLAIVAGTALLLFLPQAQRPAPDPFMTTPPHFFDWKLALVAHGPLVPSLVALYHAVAHFLDRFREGYGTDSLLHAAAMLMALHALAPFFHAHSLSPVWVWFWITLGLLALLHHALKAYARR